MYVPAEQATSVTAMGRSGSLSSHSVIVNSWITTSRGASSTGSPARASWYARRPSIWTALYCGGTWRMGPVSAAMPASTASRVRRGPSTGVRSPSMSSVVEVSPKQIVAR